MTTTSNHLGALIIALSSCLIASSAQAVMAIPVATGLPADLLTFKFDFNNVALPLSTAAAATSGYGLGNVGLSSNISLAMTTALGTIAPKASVAVTGAVATQNYNGEGRVAKTLGNTEGGLSTLKMDTFIVNNNFGLIKSTTGNTAIKGTRSDYTDRFLLTFNNFTVTSVQFDYEIFPDASCQKNSGCGPDMSFLADGIQKWIMTTAASNTTDPQKLGSTATINFSGATVLSFVDWPSEVGIDNLVITGCVAAVNGQCGVAQVPEPATLALLGLGVLGFAVVRRQKPQKQLSV